MCGFVHPEDKEAVSLEEVDDEVDEGSRPCHLHEHEEGAQNDALQSLPWRSLCGRALWQALFLRQPGALSAGAPPSLILGATADRALADRLDRSTPYEHR